MFVFVFLAALSLPFTAMPDLAVAEPTGQQNSTEKKSKKNTDAWQLLGRDGHCSSLKSLKQTFPDLPPITTPQALQQYLKTHQGTPLLYPIHDPTIPELTGYTLLDPTHNLSLIILPSKQCKGRFTPVEQLEPPPTSSPKARQ
jgi:hypothetical protein